MTKALTAASSFDTAITPQSGEKANEALFEACFQALANRTRYLYDNIGASGPSLAVNQVYGRSSSGSAGGKAATDFAFSLMALADAISHADALHTKGSDIASAAVTNIAGATGMFVHITGTTTITSFGTAAAGVVRVVRFADALTLTHNATSLVLPAGGSDITTATNDVAIAVSEGSGNWRVVSYQRASGFALVGSMGSTTFVGMTDTPGSFSGQAGKIPAVNSGESALEFVHQNVFPVASIHYLNHSLSGLDMSDYSVGEGDIVVLRSQTDPTENGPWVASSGAWSRLAPWDTAAGFANGQVFVSSGISTGTGGAPGAVIVDTVPTTVGSDPIVFRSLYRPWTTETSINFGVPIKADSIVVGGGSLNADACASFNSTTKGVELPGLSSTNRDAMTFPPAGMLIYNSTTGQLEWRNSAGSWDPRFATLRVGDTGAQVGVLDIESTDAITTPLLTLKNTTTSLDVDVRGGSGVPTYSAKPGSIYIRGGAGNAEVYVNVSTTNPGTTWSKLGDGRTYSDTISGTTYTLTDADSGRNLVFTNPTGCTVTAPAGLADGFSCLLTQLRIGGAVTVNAGVSAAVNNRSGHTKTAGRYAQISLLHIGSDEFILSGDTESHSTILDYVPVTNLKLALSTARVLKSTYAGPLVEVEEDGGSTTHGIGVDANGELDTSDLASFCGANLGTVKTAYDQAGGSTSYDYAQATSSSQPQIYDGAAVETLGGKPAMVFDGTDDVLTRSDALGEAGNNPAMDVFIAFTAPTTATSDALWSLGTGLGAIVAICVESSTQVAVRYGDGNRVLSFLGLDLTTGPHVLHMRRAAGAAYDEVDITIDGVAGSPVSTSGTTTLSLGSASDIGDNATYSPLNCVVGELLVFAAAVGNALITADAAVISADMRSFWGV